MFCSNCNEKLIANHVLEDAIIPPMSNKSKIIHPKCSLCGCDIRLIDVSTNIKADSKVLLISGTAGSGKTAIGQFIERKNKYIFIAGDAIQKKVNYFNKNIPEYKGDYYVETVKYIVNITWIGIQCCSRLHFLR